MGKSSSKPEAKQVSDTGTTDRSRATECENGTEYSTPANSHTDPSHTSQIKVRVKSSKPTLSTQGKRTSFYETVDANEVLPYLIIGKIKY